MFRRLIVPWALVAVACHVAPPESAASNTRKRRTEQSAHLQRKSATSRPRSPNRPAPARPVAPPESELRSRFEGQKPVRVLHGKASYYARKFAGRRTASGEVYDPHAFTAAHRSLPFGTILRVVRTNGGQTTYVRVTDRGPFGDRSRVVDLSRAAAEELEMIRDGVVRVRVEIVEMGQPRRKKSRARKAKRR